MARKEQEYDWLDDPFDEEKSKAEFEELKRANNRRALIAVVAIIAIVAISLFAMFSCTMGAMLSTSSI